MSVYAQVCRNGTHGKKIAGCVINGAKVAWKCENEETGGSFRKSGSIAKQSKAKERESAIWWCTDVGKEEGGRSRRRVGGKGSSVFLCRTCFRDKDEREVGAGAGPGPGLTGSGNSKSPLSTG